jgi:hypothetical protein
VHKKRMPCVHHVKRRPADCRLCCPCPHSRIKRHCRLCTPCPHGKLLSNCGLCRGCVHGRVHRHCQECRRRSSASSSSNSSTQVVGKGEEEEKEEARRAPAAAAGKAFATARRHPTGLQRQILACRQKWTCAVCASLLPAVFHVDHVKPLSLGGSHDAHNLQVLCPNCHATKSAIENSRAQGCELLMELA